MTVRDPEGRAVLKIREALAGLSPEDQVALMDMDEDRIDRAKKVQRALSTLDDDARQRVRKALWALYSEAGE